jgi:hypothetical protein
LLLFSIHVVDDDGHRSCLPAGMCPAAQASPQPTVYGTVPTHGTIEPSQAWVLEFVAPRRFERGMSEAFAPMIFDSSLTVPARCGRIPAPMKDSPSRCAPI